MHNLLQRQIRRFFGKGKELPNEVQNFIQAVDESYYQSDADRVMTERSLELASQEMLEQNRILENELKIRREAESKLDHLNNYDALTGLINHNLFNDRLKYALSCANRHNQAIVVVVLGLDFFKIINNSLGFDIGNELLQIIAERLTNSIRTSDTVARLGADEFALILIEQNAEQNPAHSMSTNFDMVPAQHPRLTDILQRILKSVSNTILLADQELQITCSLGVSLYPQDSDNATVLLSNAHAAMNTAKQLGRNNYQFYNLEMSAKMREKLIMQNNLRLALEQNEFILHYQPQVDLRTGRIIGAEALIRWNQPGKGLISPALFIGIAEETELIVQIGAWVIRTACRDCKSWQDKGYGKIRVAINLSARQFNQPNLLEFIAETLKETDLDPRLLDIELTESLIMADIERSISIFHGFKALGVTLSIDDFGTGYSSLAYLKRFPIDVLKIDQSFIRDIKNANDATIVKTIIFMAHSLGLSVIAEGVETEIQCKFLETHLCDEFQGFYLLKDFP